MSDEKKYDIKSFIKDDNSICREERQYAVFLYDILRKYKKFTQREGKEHVEKIFEACGLKDDKIEIENVFYEATFMRDFFAKIRKDGNDSFNSKLIGYLYKENPDTIKSWGIKERNLGRWLADCNDALKEKAPEIDSKKLQYMMNAKPDIAVIYEKDEQKELLFLECKFESDESYYGEGDDKISQTKVQGMVAEFLCQHILYGVGVSEKMKKKDNDDRAYCQSHTVRFVKKDPDPNKGEIQISKLITLSKEIFQ